MPKKTPDGPSKGRSRACRRIVAKKGPFLPRSSIRHRMSSVNLSATIILVHLACPPKAGVTNLLRVEVCAKAEEQLFEHHLKPHLVNLNAPSQDCETHQEPPITVLLFRPTRM